MPFAQSSSLAQAMPSANLVAHLFADEHLYPVAQGADERTSLRLGHRPRNKKLFRNGTPKRIGHRARYTNYPPKRSLALRSCQRQRRARSMRDE